MTSTDFDQLLRACDSAVAKGSIEEVARTLDELVSHCDACSASEITLLESTRLACLLIDGGGVLERVDYVERGRAIFEDRWDQLLPMFGASQLNYNIANGYKAQFNIERRAPEWRFTPETSETVLRAKSHYWKAMREATPVLARPELVTNLAIALSSSARVVDALHYLDFLLKQFPKFGMAHVNRGQVLEYLNRISNSYSIKLLFEMFSAFDKASKSDNVEESVLKAALANADRVAQVLRDHGHETSEDPHSEKKTEEFHREHDPYWRWCLDHSLALSEHSLYCRCEGARRDDLSILTSGAGLAGSKVPGMELLLNRLKAEYCLSRALLFQSTAPDASLKWDVAIFEGTFTDLLDDEQIGMRSEFLRTSFRLCFGVLDRIARGICNFFDLATGKEDIYFHKFWRSGGSNERWDALNRSNNPSLVALYGLARDLSEQSSGEWSHLRKYRNLFEHELCIIRGDNADPKLPPWLIDTAPPSISLNKIQSDAAEMLRFSRAAIFYFAFLVRWDSQLDIDLPGAPTMTFKKKPLGKD